MNVWNDGKKERREGVLGKRTRPIGWKGDINRNNKGSVAGGGCGIILAGKKSCQHIPARNSFNHRGHRRTFLPVPRETALVRERHPSKKGGWKKKRREARPRNRCRRDGTKSRSTEVERGGKLGGEKRKSVQRY